MWWRRRRRTRSESARLAVIGQPRAPSVARCGKGRADGSEAVSRLVQHAPVSIDSNPMLGFVLGRELPGPQSKRWPPRTVAGWTDIWSAGRKTQGELGGRRWLVWRESPQPIARLSSSAMDFDAVNAVCAAIGKTLMCTISSPAHWVGRMIRAISSRCVMGAMPHITQISK